MRSRITGYCSVSSEPGTRTAASLPLLGPLLCCAPAVPSARFLWTGCAPSSTASAAAGRGQRHVLVRRLTGGSPLYTSQDEGVGRLVALGYVGTCQSPAVVHNNLLQSYTTIVPISCSRTQQRGGDCRSSSAVTHGDSHLIARARDRRPAAVVVAGSRLGATCADAGARGRSARRRAWWMTSWRSSRAWPHAFLAAVIAHAGQSASGHVSNTSSKAKVRAPDAHRYDRDPRL